MKLRATFLVFASLLLMRSLANADQTSTPADPASANLVAIFAAPAPPNGGTAKLPWLAPAPSNKDTLSCGSCSDTPCVGQPVGRFCGVLNGETYTCQRAYVICTARDCECWTGPLP